MTHTSTEQPRENCTACNATGSGSDGWDCLLCDGDGWVFAYPESEAAKKNTITEQPSLAAIIRDLRESHARTSPGTWGKGATTHETVSRSKGREPYKVAEFRHANDAQFCDLAHVFVPRLLSEIEALQSRAVREAVLQEREECAKVCDELVSANACACQIRARGEPEQPTLPYHPAMMNEIINMADEIAICFSADSKEFDHDGLLRFAAMVQANEREACAQVCESQAGTASMFASSRDAKTHAAATKDCASAIRARQ